MTGAILPGRGCNGCTLCCKVLAIPEIEKPSGVMCGNCENGGCKIYTRRPDACATFHCLYLTNARLGEEWRPDKCGMVVVFEEERNVVGIVPDEDRQGAWRAAPYHAQLKQWAAIFERNNVRLMVQEARGNTLILPEQDFFLGVLGPDMHVLIETKAGARGLERTVSVVNGDDPRLPQNRASG